MADVSDGASKHLMGSIEQVSDVIPMSLEQREMKAFNTLKIALLSVHWHVEKSTSFMTSGAGQSALFVNL